MIETDSIRKIRRIPRFSGVSAEATAWLAERLSVRSYAKGAMLFVEGEDSTHLWLVESGAVKVFRSLESGRELILGIFRFGDAIGEVAVIDGTGYPASASAHEDATLWVLPRQAYFTYLERFEGAAIALIRDLTLRMRVMQRRMEDLGGGGVEYRIARVLTALCAKSPDQSSPVYLPIPLTRQDLADMVGARIETVIRIVSRWQKEGLIGQDERGLCVRDRRALAQLAGGA